MLNRYNSLFGEKFVEEWKKQWFEEKEKTLGEPEEKWEKFKFVFGTVKVKTKKILRISIIKEILFEK